MEKFQFRWVSRELVPVMPMSPPDPYLLKSILIMNQQPTQENFIGYRSIPNLINHARYVMSRHDYKGRDINGDPIYEHTSPYPVKFFYATHKLGGSNCSIQLNGPNPDNWIYQSREKVLFEGEDNFGFRTFMISPEGQTQLKAIYDFLVNYFLGQTKFIVYGEWFGKGVKEKAIHSQFPNKMFFIFDIRKEDGTFLSAEQTTEFSLFASENYMSMNGPLTNIYSIYHPEWPGFVVRVDYNMFGETQPWENKNFNELALTNSLKDIADQYTLNCPIAEKFGIKGLGEGLVLRELVPYEDNPDMEFVQQIDNDDNGVIFKIKNRKYESAKNVIETPKQMKEKDPKLVEFLGLVCNENRLEQFFNKMISPSMKNFIGFADMVNEDILKEEQIAVENYSIDVKKLKGEVVSFVKPWYQEMLTQEVTTVQDGN